MGGSRLLRERRLPPHDDWCLGTQVEQQGGTLLGVSHPLFVVRQDPGARIAGALRLERGLQLGVSRVDGAAGVPELAEDRVHLAFEPRHLAQPDGVNLVRGQARRRKGAQRLRVEGIPARQAPHARVVGRLG